VPTSKSTRIFSFFWLGSKFIPAIYQGVLMPSADSNIFSVTISTLLISVRLIRYHSRSTGGIVQACAHCHGQRPFPAFGVSTTACR
jgi:hypothetical protein